MEETDSGKNQMAKHNRTEKQIAVMQPYFFPYIGYWQLMNEADTFVIYDDVNFIKKGWINRNRILINKEVHFINLPCKGISQNKLIKEIQIMTDEKAAGKLLRTLELAYKRAPYFHDAMPVIEEVLKNQNPNLAEYLQHQLSIVADYLKIRTEFAVSSQIEKNPLLKAEDKVIEICEKVGGTAYINPICGAHLYTKEKFKTHGLDLRFLELPHIQYRQYAKNYMENLSIIDVMMFNEPDRIREFLAGASVINASEVSSNAPGQSCHISPDEVLRNGGTF